MTSKSMSLVMACLVWCSLAGCGSSDPSADATTEITVDTGHDAPLDTAAPADTGSLDSLLLDAGDASPGQPDVPADTTCQDDACVQPDSGGVEVVDVQGEEWGGGCIDVYPGQVVITEVMLSPTEVDAAVGGFVELVNVGDTSLVMKGWYLEDAVGGSASLTLPEGASFEPMTFLVVALEGDPAVNGGIEPDLVVEGLDLASGRLVVTVEGVTIDAVDWTDPEGWPLTPGAAMSLDWDYTAYASNDDPASWCPASTPYGDGDLGSPGQKNPPCPEVSECGDGVTEGDEQCDDGADGDEGDGCTDGCLFSCVDPLVDCTDVPGDCLVPVCVASEDGQRCDSLPAADDLPDDGNACTADGCGDGIATFEPMVDGTPCDDGQGEGGDYCVEGTCGPAECGDHVEGPLEECDDGNLDPEDGCSPTCTLEACGNGLVDALEDCDDGKNGDPDDGCRDDCSYTCADPAVDCPVDVVGDCMVPACEPSAGGQTCASVPADDPPPSAAGCVIMVCQEGQAVEVPAADGTPCDNGAGASGDYCVAGACGEAVCGDGLPGPLEACDDGNTDPCDGCLHDCTVLVDVCGDGYVCPPYQCDDGATEDGDGCSSGCMLEGTPCPPDMVYVPADATSGVTEAYCMDTYEASRQDATAMSMGKDVTVARSVAGVIPWYQKPIDEQGLLMFDAACQAAGKRLCQPDEWYHGCAGSDDSTYVWGDTWDDQVCNGVDTWCETYCTDNAIDPAVIGDGCGYSLYYQYPELGPPFHVLPTGSMAGCVNEQGAYDVNGNVWEIVPSDSGPNGWPFEIRGGAFNCGASSSRLMCTYVANWSSLYAGFRCCKDPVE